MSLHVLLFPKIHAVQHPWIRAMQRVSPALKREIRAFAFLYVDAFPDCFIPTAADAARSRCSSTRSASLSDADAALELARPLFFYWERGGGGPERLPTRPSATGRSRSRARRPGDAGARARGRRVRRPGALRDRLVALLERYWEEAFAAEWRRLEPLLRAAVAESEQLIAAAGPMALLSSVPRPAPRRRHARPPLAARAHRRGLAGESAAARAERLRLAARARQLRSALADHGRLRGAVRHARGGPRRGALDARADRSAPPATRPGCASSSSSASGRGRPRSSPRS